jgi:hydroxyacylglutathione hydrolase
VKIQGVTVGPLEENCWLIVDEAAGDAVLIDPGDEADTLVKAVDASGARLSAIWLTHAHFDHIGGIAGVRRAFPGVPIFLHPLDRPLYAFGADSAARWGITLEQPPAPDRELADGDVVTCGTLAFRVQHVPGHAPGHVMFVADGAVFSGDLLFAGSIGRTDLPLCDPSAMQRSLALAALLDPATVVHPGHGPRTTIGRELDTNPFLNGIARVVGA